MISITSFLFWLSMGHPSADRHRKLDLWVCCSGEQSGLVMWYFSELLGRISKLPQHISESNTYFSVPQEMFSLLLPQFPIKRYCPADPLPLMVSQLWQGKRKVVEMVRGNVITQAECMEWEGYPGQHSEDPHIKSSGTPTYIQLGAGVALGAIQKRLIAASSSRAT